MTSVDGAPALSQLTTIAVGGPAARLLAPASRDALVETAREVWASDEEWLLLGGGSNTVVADEGFDGTVIRVVTRGIERLDVGGAVRLRVQAGEPWDELVVHTVEHGWSGIEALSGIPGSVGAAPVQNIGAYGQELSDSLVGIEFLDYDTEQVLHLSAAELELGYRSSALKRGRRGVVLSIDLELANGTDADAAAALGAPVAYAQLASALGVELGARIPLAQVRQAVLRLRAAKGMLLSPDDPDSVSAGSFFTNPIVSDRFAATLPADAPRWPLEPDSDEPVIVPLENFVPGQLLARGVPAPGASQYHVEGGSVKLSAAWLIEHSGVTRGFSLPGSGAAISTKHTLALVNRGWGTASDIAELARYVQSRVLNAFGVILQPEPILVGVHL